MLCRCFFVNRELNKVIRTEDALIQLYGHVDLYFSPISTLHLGIGLYFALPFSCYYVVQGVQHGLHKCTDVLEYRRL